MATYIPYCGTPPIPGHLAWNTDPVLAGALIAFAALYALGTHKKPAAPNTQVLFWSGWIVLSLALMSPLCNLSVALFSARVAQHVLVTFIAAPLLVLGRIDRIFALLPGLRAETFLSNLGKSARSQVCAVLLFALVMWLWHVPFFYDATFHSTLVYWTMHVTMIGAAMIFWATTFGTASIASALIATFGTMLQMSLLGAILAFTGMTLFTVHAGTTWAWGLTQLQDQQLGGLVIWVVGGFFTTAYAAVLLARCISDNGSLTRSQTLAEQT